MSKYMPPFSSFSFQKSAAEIKEKAAAKIERLKVKIEDREKRIIDIRVEYGIDDAALVSLLQQARRDQLAATHHSYSYLGVSGPSLQLAQMFRGAQGAVGIQGPEGPTGPTGGSDAPLSREQRTVGIGIIQMILTEQDAIEDERHQIGALELLARNLEPIPRHTFVDGVMVPFEEEQKFTLTREELVYLKF